MFSRAHSDSTAHSLQRITDGGVGAEFVLEGDLVDACKPGDRVMMTGVYMPVGSKSVANITGQFRSVIVVNSVEQLSKVVHNSADITPEDLRELRALAAKPDVLDILGMSMAPSIYGHDWIKKVRLLRS